MAITEKVSSTWKRFARSPLSGPLYIATLFKKEVRYAERDGRRRIEPQQDGRDPRWAVIDATESLITDRLGGRGVCQVQYVAALPDVPGVSVWLVTESDAARDALLASSSEPCIDEVRDIFLAAGWPADQAADIHTTSQSLETVDRDYESSWFRALR